MTAQKGRELVLKLGDGAMPEVFTTVGGLRTKTLTINDEPVDVTTADETDRWRRLLIGAGIRSMSMSGEGLFVDDTTVSAILTHVMGADTAYKNWQVIVPGLGTFEGPFHVSTLGFGGAYNDGASENITLESAGEITFQAAA